MAAFIGASKPTLRSNHIEDGDKHTPNFYFQAIHPEAISSENFLAARALMSATFVHNIATTKEARVSNLYKEAPKFRDQIDILA